MENKNKKAEQKEKVKRVREIRTEKGVSNLGSLVNENSFPLNLPHQHGFNGAIVEFEDKYICVYRSGSKPYTTHVPQFSACFLNNDFSTQVDTLFTFKLTQCLDPRLIWHKNKLLMFYSSAKEGIEGEHVMVTTIIDLDKSPKFVNRPSYRVSPVYLVGRQKNWVPFHYNNILFLVVSASPHMIYSFEMQTDKVHSELAYRTLWEPTMIHEDLRCNTNPILINNNFYLNTFHVVSNCCVQNNNLKLYDNFCYVFDKNPPFRVIRSGHESYARAEDACSVCPEGVGKGHLVIFPTSIIQKNEELYISYGDNDCGVRILKTTVEDMLDTTTPLIKKIL
jgi:predicted GH43/DUF377 family glycosyl hydrolase